MEDQLLRGDIKSTFLKYLLPSIGGMLGTSLYILGDTIMIGQALGGPGLAAVNISIPLLKVANSIGLIVGVGGATLVSISRGRGDEERANEIFNMSMLVGLLLGAILTFVSLRYVDEITWMLGATEFSFEMTKTYLRLVMATAIPTILTYSLGIFVRNDGSPNLVMLASLVSSLFNLVLDYILIFNRGLGIWGGAFATALSPIVSTLILSLHWLLKKNKLSFKLPEWNFNILARIFSIGFPSAIIEFSAGFVIFMFNKVIFDLVGDLGVSAYSIIGNLSLVFNAIFNGMGQAVQPIISINYGAKQMDRVYEATRLGIITAFIFGLLFFFTGFIFPDKLASLFTSEKGELINITIRGIRLYFTAFILMGVNIVMTSYVQSQEDARTSTIISLLRGSVYVILVLIVMSSLLGIEGVWLTMLVVEILTMLTYTLVFEKCRRAMGHVFKSK